MITMVLTIKSIITAALIAVTFKLYSDFIFSRGTIMKPSAALLLLGITVILLTILITILFTYA